MRRSLRRGRKPAPTFREEIALFSQGYSLVVGLDEVGRGPLAGPVVAAAVILGQRPKGTWVGLIRDSKQMTPVQRERVFPYLLDAAVALELGACSSGEVDALGIVAATRLAMKRAIDSLRPVPQFLLLDAIYLPDVPIPQKAIIRGDAQVLSIAAASIAAKVTRDKMMEEADQRYPGYGFARHKGYGTAEHMGNLERLGPCEIHRSSFAPIKHLIGA